MLARAVTAITSKAENLYLTVSTALPIGAKSHFFAAALTFSKPLDAPDKFRLCLSLSRVPRVVLTLLSKFLLSNCISTTLLSIVVLITW